MQYALLFNETEAGFSKRTHPQEAEAYWGGWTAYMAALAQAGVMVAGKGLQVPAMATTVRLRDGERLVEDGPVADTKEQLGGFVVIEVPDLDAALSWAAKAPSASYASVEVRPALPPPAGAPA